MDERRHVSALSEAIVLGGAGVWGDIRVFSTGGMPRGRLEFRYLTDFAYVGKMGSPPPPPTPPTPHTHTPPPHPPNPPDPAQARMFKTAYSSRAQRGYPNYFRFQTGIFWTRAWRGPKLETCRVTDWYLGRWPN